jgi:glucose 1-dehydrogenase
VRAARGAELRIVVTGGAGAIAAALCRALHAQGQDAGHERLHALLVDRDAPRLDATARQLRDAGLLVETLAGDLAEPALPARAIEHALQCFGGIDAVFSNAAVPEGAAVGEMAAAAWDRSFDVNLRAAWLLARAAYAPLAASGGSFLATGSIGARAPGLAAPVYSASKAALLTLVEQLALEWAEAGIRVNAVSPGSTLTPMNRLWHASEPERAQQVAGYPLRRMASPDEIGAAMAFLAGPQATYISGSNLVVDGALSLSIPLQKEISR